VNLVRLCGFAVLRLGGWAVGWFCGFRGQSRLRHRAPSDLRHTGPLFQRPIADETKGPRVTFGTQTRTPKSHWQTTLRRSHMCKRALAHQSHRQCDPILMANHTPDAIFAGAHMAMETHCVIGHLQMSNSLMQQRPKPRH